MPSRSITKTIPFVGPPNQRATGTIDRRYVNVLFELNPNAVAKTQELDCVKRPGLSTFSQPSGGNANGRGIYAWGATSTLYSVFNNSIYSGTSTLISTLAASTGRCWFEQTPATDTNQVLIVSDGDSNYNITLAGVISTINASNATNYPTSNLGPVLYIDGYIIQGLPNGRMRNTRLNTVSSWDSAGFLSVTDALEALLRQKDQVLALSKNSIKAYFNNGATPAPLLQIEQNRLDFGIASKNSLAQSGSVAMFVGENSASGDGGRSVWRVQAGKIAEVSNAVINRFLRAEGQSISSCSAWMERPAGQLIYVLNLVAANRSFVYNVDNDTWPEWEAAAGGARFNGVSATSLDGTVYVQDASNGRVYTISPTVYQDAGTNFTMTIQTERLAYQTDENKVQDKLFVIGDTTTGTLNVSYSDDDYGSFSTPRPIDMSLADKYLTRLGSFVERSYRFTYAENTAMRLQGFRNNLRVG